MSVGDIESRERALEIKVAELLAQVAELQRAAARFEDTDAPSLAEREQLLREAERAAHLGTWSWDIDTGRVTWSEELHRILGLEPGTVVPSVELFFNSVHPEDRVRAEASAQQGLVDGVLPPVPCRIVRPDASLRHTISSGSYLFDTQGRARRMVGGLLDRTTYLQVESNLRGALKLLEEAQRVAQLGSWRMFMDTGEAEWSLEFRRIAGVPADMAPDVSVILGLIVEEDRPHFLETHSRNMMSPEGGEMDGRLKRPDGEVRHVRFKGVLVSAPGERPELRGTMQDITDQVRLREDLVQSQKMEAVGRLAGGIAHDFNNLLMVVLGNLTLLEPQITDVQALRESMHALESASNLTRRLLAFGRKAQLTLRLTDPNELVRSTLALLNRLVGGQVKLKTDLATTLPQIEVDVVELERALVNLVVNSRDVMPNGGVVTIHTREHWEGNARRVEISVSDDGPGISAVDLPHIFEPFYTTRSGSGGTGMGLATVLGTAEQHGGTVRVAARDGGGAVFSILLPAVAVARVPSDQPPVPLPVVRNQERLTFLVIDDEPSVAQVILRLLKARGHTVHLATLPDQARDLWTQHHAAIDLVICDVMMPDMPGPALIAQLSQIALARHVLFISGYFEGISRQDYDHPVLGKPFTPATLHAAVEEVLRGK